MNKNTLFIIGGAAAVAAYFYSQKNAAENLKVYFNGIDLQKAKGLNLPTVLAKFRLVNPTSSSLVITSIAGDINVNGSQFSTVQQTDAITVPGASEVIYTIKLKTPILSAVSTIYQLITKKQKLKVTFTGAANSRGIIIPINETIFA